MQVHKKDTSATLKDLVQWSEAACMHIEMQLRKDTRMRIKLRANHNNERRACLTVPARIPSNATQTRLTGLAVFCDNEHESAERDAQLD